MSLLERTISAADSGIEGGLDHTSIGAQGPRLVDTLIEKESPKIEAYFEASPNAQQIS